MSNSQGQPEVLAVSALSAAKMLGIARSQVFKLLKENQFPKPIKIGKRNPRWLIADLKAYLANGGSHA